MSEGTMVNVVPQPVSFTPSDGIFPLEGASVGGRLAGYAAQVLGLDVSAAEEHSVTLALVPGHGPEAYRLEVAPHSISLTADHDAGLFYGIQTLRQLVSGDGVPAGTIVDYPRFAYRGAMLDVARHFFSVADVKRYIDDIALLKFNHLHLHLTDDQGWRIQIDSWPELTGIGASTQVGGNGGGFYTKDEYREIVEYAASRFVTIVPEIDMPGHTNAAISAYPELGDAPVEPYEGIEVGFSSLKIRSDRTYLFLADVVRELAELTPGPYLHLGGDESLATTDEDFLLFIARATALGAATGKTVIGWHEMGRSGELPPGTIGQYWSFTTPQEGAAEHTLSFVKQGGRVIMSPADVAYLDMAYEVDAPLGLVWANGPTTLKQAYGWDPAEVVPGLDDEHILGVEAPLWTETLSTIEHLEEMAFPRAAAIAETAWSPRAVAEADESQRFADFTSRLLSLSAVWDAAGIRHRPIS